MNILMLLETEFPPDVRVENEAVALVQAGHEVTIVVPTFGERPSQETIQGVQIRRFQTKQNWLNKLKGTAARMSLYHVWWIKKVQSLVDLNQFDAVHIHDLPLAWSGERLGRIHGLKFVLDFHENFPALLVDSGNTVGLLKSFFYSLDRWKKYEQWAVDQADRIIVVVDEAAERLQALGIPSNKIFVVSNTPNPEVFQPLQDKENDKENDDFVISYIGGFGPHRGIDIVIRAMPEILQIHPQTRLRLIGAGKGRDAYERLIHELHVTESVEIISWIPFNQVALEIAGSDACLVPHAKTEHTDSTIPHKLFQYMAMEKPVIVSDCLPLKRIVEKTQCGIVFQAGNPQSLANRIHTLFDPSGARQMGESGRRAVLETYHWSHDSEVLCQLYRQLG